MGIVSSEGREALTLARLAGEADAAVGGLYRYFESKDALLVAMQARAIARFHSFLVQCLAVVPAELDPREAALHRVLTLPHAWARFAAEEPALHGLIDSSLSTLEPSLTEEAARTVEAVIEPLLSRCTRELAAAARLGAVQPGDARLRTMAMWAVVHGTDHFRKRDRLVPHAHNAAAIRRHLVDALMLGWGALPSALAAARAVTTTES